MENFTSIKKENNREIDGMKSDLTLLSKSIDSAKSILNLSESNFKSEYAKKRYGELKSIQEGKNVRFNKDELEIIASEMESLIRTKEEELKNQEENGNKRNDLEMLNKSINSSKGILNLSESDFKSEYAKKRYGELKIIQDRKPANFNKNELEIIAKELEDFLSRKEPKKEENIEEEIDGDNITKDKDGKKEEEGIVNSDELIAKPAEIGGDMDWIEEELSKPMNETLEQEDKNLEEKNRDIERERRESIEKIEERVSICREKYIKEFEKCNKEMKRQLLIERTRNATLNIMAGVKNIFSSKDKIEHLKRIKKEDVIKEGTKESKKEYDQVRKEMGEQMFANKKAELEVAGLSGKELEEALKQYKATEILAKTIIQERQKIINLKIQNPALWKKLLDGYMKIKPRWKRVALSTLIFLPVAASGAIGASAIAAGGVYAGIAGLALFKFTASMAIGAGVAQTAKGIDWVKKDSDLKFANEMATQKFELKNKFSSGEMELEDYEKSIEVIEVEEKKRSRNRALLKASVGIALGFGAGFGTYVAMGNILDNTEGIISSTADNSSTHVNSTTGITKPAVGIPGTMPGYDNIRITDETINGPVFNPNHVYDNIKPGDIAEKVIGKTNIEAVANDGQGAISTLYELQTNLKAEYPDINNAPESVKHILETNPNELAKEYGLYNPGEDAESAKVYVGDKMSFNKETGEVVFTHARGGEDILQKGVEYKGGMFDSGNRGTEVTVDDGKEGTSDFVKDNPQVPPTENVFANSSPIPNSEEVPSRFLDTHPQVPPDVNNAENTNTEVNQVSKKIDDFNYKEAQGDDQAVSKGQETDSITRDLSNSEMRQVDRVFDRNIDELFPKKQDMAFWDGIKSLSADKLYNMNESQINPKIQPLYDYMTKINEVTGIEPIGRTLTIPAETNLEFINRGLKEAALIGKLDNIKL